MSKKMKVQTLNEYRKELVIWTKEYLKLYNRVKMDTQWGKGYVAGKHDAFRFIIRKIEYNFIEPAIVKEIK